MGNAGTFSRCSFDKIFGAEANRLYKDAQKLTEEIIKGNWFTADGVSRFLAGHK
jgi:5-methyltetrahydrofolate--homocysteine methyltransferase